MILDACEHAARAEGFQRAELAATLAGEPLYRACGYVERFSAKTSASVDVPLLRMGRTWRGAKQLHKLRFDLVFGSAPRHMVRNPGTRPAADQCLGLDLGLNASFPS